MADRRARWGILGTARINERLIPAIRESERSELVAVASRSQSKANDFAKKWQIPRAHWSYESLLADPDVDVVYISLPNGFHAEWSVKCADAGKHVLCEKPLALNVDEVEQMAEAAKRNKVVIQEAAMYRYHPQTRQVQELIASGAIGEIRMIQSLFTFTLRNPGDVRLDLEIGGGSLWDLGSYPVSFTRLVMKTNPVEVAAWQIASEQGVDLTLMGQMRFDNGALAQFGCSFQSVPHWEMNIVGSRGRINLDIPWMQRTEPAHVRLYQEKAQGAATFGDSGVHLMDTFTSEGRSAYYHEVESMAACILDGAPPVISLDDSRGNVATLVALYASARENRVVKVDFN